MKIIIAGGSGFLGTALAAKWRGNHDIVVLCRNPKAFAVPDVRSVDWDGRSIGTWRSELEGADLLLNLTGKSVNCRYTRRNKAGILSSRVNSTRVLGQAVMACRKPPRVWMNASSATIYPAASGSPRDEGFSSFENDFSVQVCKAWETAFLESQAPWTRKLILRTSIVLGHGGALPVYARLARMGLGGRHVDGTQMFSWIHIDDFAGVIEWLMANESASGIYNIAAPHAVSNAEFMEALRAALGLAWGLRAPAWTIRLVAGIIGTEPELLLKSRWVVPARLFREGYRFRYGHAAEALRALLR